MKLLSTLGALAAGAGAMYYFDPQQGRRRRALLGDRLTATTHDARDYLANQGRRAGDRAYGWYSSACSAVRNFVTAADPPDEKLNARIRARLGRLVSHPHAIETRVQNGRVTLRGPVLAHEQGALMAAVWSMQGVTGIDNQLTAHDQPGDVPGLQGKPHRSGRRRMRRLAGSSLPAVALAAGIGAAMRALGGGRNAHRGLASSVALALVTYGLGGGARQYARRRHLLPAKHARPQESTRHEQPSPQMATMPPAAAGPAPTWQH